MLIKEIEKTLERLSLKHLFRPKPPVLSPQGAVCASFNQRMLASTIDAFIIILLITPFNNAITAYAYRDFYVDPEAAKAVLAAAKTQGEAQLAMFKLQWDSGLREGLTTLLQIQYTLFAVYSFVFWHFYSGTPGKLLLGLRVVDAKSGARVSDWQSAIRVGGYLLSGMVFMLGFFSISFSKQRQGWHDKLAGTLVVKKIVKSALPLAAPSDSPAP